MADQAATWGSMEVHPHPLHAAAWHVAPPASDHDEKATFSHRPKHVNHQASSHGQATTDSNRQAARSVGWCSTSTQFA